MTDQEERIATLARERAREALDQILSRAGYSVNSPEDLANLARDMRWVAEKRALEESSDKRWFAVIGAVIVAAISSIGTILAAWATNRWSH